MDKPSLIPNKVYLIIEDLWKREFVEKYFTSRSKFWVRRFLSLLV